MVIREAEFLKKYFEIDVSYRKMLNETLRESLLDDLVISALKKCGCEGCFSRKSVGKAIDRALVTRKPSWYPDAIKTLVTLRERGYKLGLISNTHWRFLEQTKNEFKMYFDTIILSYEHGYAKPHPSIFLVALERLGVMASRCLHVGDDPIADVEGARTVGMKTAFIKRRNKKANADIEIEQLSELLKFLETV